MTWTQKLDFPATKILREIDFAKFRFLKTVTLRSSDALCQLRKIVTLKFAKKIPKSNFRAFKIVQLVVAFQTLDLPVLISRKI